MNIKKLMINDLQGQELADAFTNLLAFEGLKKELNGRLLSEYYIAIGLDPEKWRSYSAVFIGIPWELSELDEYDIEVLRQVNDMLVV